MIHTITLRGHFDGERIQIDEPYRLEPGTRLIITALPQNTEQDDQMFWSQLAQVGLARAYGDAEPEYVFEMIREANPDYETG